MEKKHLLEVTTLKTEMKQQKEKDAKKILELSTKLKASEDQIKADKKKLEEAKNKQKALKAAAEKELAGESVHRVYGSTVVDISISPSSFKPVSLFLSRISCHVSPLF